MMTVQFLNDMYLIAIKSKLQRNAISTEEKLKMILEELNTMPEHIKIDDSSNDIYGSPQDLKQPIGQSFQSETIPLQKNVTISTVEENAIKITESKYAQCPEEEGFLNRDLETSDDGQYYVIEMTNDLQLAYYSLMVNSRTSREIMQTPQFAPNFAIEFENSPGKELENLSIVKKGVLHKDGRYWKIVELCKAKWV